MGTVVAIGTSLFQIVFVTLNVSILHATFNYSVDLILAIFLLIGGVIGAQYGSKFTSRFKGEQIRILLNYLSQTELLKNKDILRCLDVIAREYGGEVVNKN